MSELKRKQSTAVILLGVIGAEFGQDITGTDNNKKRSEDRRKSSVVEGFGKCSRWLVENLENYQCKCLSSINEMNNIFLTMTMEKAVSVAIEMHLSTFLKIQKL